MRGKNLVSVIMIFWNAGQFIREAIESVLAQTYPAWELLLVDDGSTDESSSIAREYAERCPEKICYLQHEGHQNRGMSASRNLGIAQARGELIAFLDADDVWLPHKLERQVAILEKQGGASMVYGPTQWWYSWTGKPEDQWLDFIHGLGIQPNTLLQPPTLLTRFLRAEGISPCTCSVLIRREAIERVGGFEEDFRDMYEDQAFFAKLCLKEPVYVSSECLARYRQHPRSNASLTLQEGRHAQARLRFLNWLAMYMQKGDIQDAGAWKALQHEMRPYRRPAVYRIVEAVRRSWMGQAYRFALGFRRRWLSLPLVRQLRCLQFRRLHPLGSGKQRGTPVVRYYWDDYLRKNQSDIRGRALEIGTTATIRKYGGEAVTSTEAIDLAAHSPEVSVVADLSRADHVPADRYDCFINQFSMHLIYDVEAALYHSIRILKPGGVLLANFPCLDYYFPTGLDMGTGSPLFMYWWFTPLQVENILRRSGLTDADYRIDVYGNLFARIAYQLNMPAEELTQRELNSVDAGHPLLICVRVVKPADWNAVQPEYRTPWAPGAAPAQWNPVTGHYTS